MKYLSLFSGIGGFELGIQQAYDLQKLRTKDEGQPKGTPSGDKKGQREQLPKLSDEGLSCIGYSEIDKYAIQIYNKHFNHKNYGDITTINATELPDFDLIVGGFPCQAFSIAGKRKGFADTRGTLFFDIARIIKEKRPRYLLLENVKGLLSHNSGDTFKTIISTLDELGYDLQWQVLNSKNFGVPQNRERVFIIGHLRGTSRPEVFPIGGTNSQDINQLNQPKHSNDRIYGEDGLSPTLNTMQGGRRQPFVMNPLKDKTQFGWHFEQNVYDENGLTRTVKAGGGSGNMPKLLKDSKIRRLTPIECERLQGFPDGWTQGLSDTQRYKTLGNAVTTNVVKAVVDKLLS